MLIFRDFCHHLEDPNLFSIYNFLKTIPQASKPWTFQSIWIKKIITNILRKIFKKVSGLMLTKFFLTNIINEILKIALKYILSKVYQRFPS